MSFLWYSRAVGSRQNSPTDHELQSSLTSRHGVTDAGVLLAQPPPQQQQLQQPNLTGQFDGSVSSSSAAVTGSAGLNDAFFATQYMMDAVQQQQQDYNQQVDRLCQSQLMS